MPRQFHPVRFFVIMAVVVFIASGITSFYTHRAKHGLSSDERAGYAVGMKVGQEAPADAGDQGNWDLGFENGYADGFQKTHPSR
jgi:hypothetical protein